MTLARRLFSGTTQLTVSSGLVRLLSIATLPILTALLSPHAYGVAALAGTVVSLVSVFALSGIDMSYARAYYSAEPPTGASVEHYCWRFAIGTGLATATIAGLAWWFINRNSDELGSELAVLVALGILLSVVNAMASTRAWLGRRFTASAIAIAASGVITAATSIVIALFWRRDALALLIPMMLGYLVPALMLGVPSLRGLSKPSGLSRDQGTSLIKIGVAGVITAPMFWLLSSSDRWFLQHFLGAESVGIYSIGYSVAVMGMMINNAVMSVWLPEASHEYERDAIEARETLGRLMSRLVAAMCLVWLIPASAGGDAVRWLADERFHQSAVVVPYIAGGVFFYGVSQLAMHGLMLVKQLKWAALWWLVGGLVCSVANWILVPRYGITGAAITQTLSFFFISVAILVTSQLKYPLQLVWGRLGLVILLTLGAGAVMSPAWHTNAPLSIAMKLPAGILVSFIVARVIAPDWFDRGIAWLRLKKSRG